MIIVKDLFQTFGMTDNKLPFSVTQYREQHPDFSRFTPFFAHYMTHSPNFLEANMYHIHSFCDYAFLPEDFNETRLLYPVFLCHWHTGSTHFTKRSGLNNLQLIYTHCGRGILNLENQIYTLEKDTLCLLDCRLPHHFFADSPDGWEYSFLHFSGDTSNAICSLIREHGILRSDVHKTKILPHYRRLFQLADENLPDFSLLFHRELTNLLVEFSHIEPVCGQQMIPAWVSQTQSYIWENYCENWSIKDLARHVSFSESYFSHSFKNYFQVSPLEYRDYLRMERAKELLLNSGCSIESISDQIGYRTISHFYNKFQQTTGLSPGKFRRKYRDGSGQGTSLFPSLFP